MLRHLFKTVFFLGSLLGIFYGSWIIETGVMRLLELNHIFGSYGIWNAMIADLSESL